MRIATGILGLVLSVAFFVQAMLVYTLATDARSDAGAVGILAAFLMFVGGAFAFGLPRVAMVVFALSGLLALVNMGQYPDLAVWSGAAFVFAAMSYFADRGQRRGHTRSSDA